MENENKTVETTNDDLKSGFVEKISIKEIKQEIEKEKLEKDDELFHRIMKKIMKLDETK